MGKKVSVGDIALIIMFSFYPLVMTDGYFNISITKHVVLSVVTLFALLYMLIKFYLHWIKKDELGNKEVFKNIWKSATTIDKFVATYFLVSVLTFVLCENKKLAFTGAEDLNMGLSFTGICVGLYAVIRLNDINMELIMRTAGRVLMVVVAFAMLQFCGVDFFCMLGAIQESERINYLSTWGNTCIFGVYLVLVAPLVLYNYFFNSGKKRKVEIANCAALYIGLLISNTDATYLGFVVLVLFWLWMSIKKENSFVAMMNIFTIWGVTGVAVKLVFVVLKHRPISSLGRVGMSIPWCIMLITIGLVGAWVIERRKISLSQIRKIVKLFLLSTVVLSIGVLLLLIYFSTYGVDHNLGRLSNYLRYNEDWGTGRGYVWNLCMEIFREMPVNKKIFGLGQGTLAPMLLYTYGDRMLTEIGYYFANAHCVYLHRMLTTGILGVTVYVMVLINGILKKVDEDVQIAYALKSALMAGAIVDIVVIFQPLTVPFIWIYLAILSKIGKK